MTPQQDELQLAFEAWAAENGVTAQRYQGKLGLGYWGEANRFFRAYKDAWNRRAPAPTEPAVDRDAVTRLDVMSLIRAQMHRVYASAIDREDIDTKYMVEIEAAIRALATPASPAVPAEHVAEVGSTYQLVWAGSGPIAPIVEKYGLKVGSKLYAHPAAVQAVPAPAPLAPNFADLVQVDRKRVYIRGGVQQFLMAYEPETDDEAKWYAGQLRKFLTAQASQPTSTPEAVNLLVEEAKRVMGQDGGAEGGDGERLAGHRSDWYLMANCRRLLSRNYARKPNWVIACELFATGSTSAIAICKRAGIDPEATKIDRAALQPQEQS